MTITINEANGKTYLNGLISEADVRNGNKRLYPYSILKPSILDLAKRVDEGDIYCEREHPQRGEVDAALACGKLVEVTWNDAQKNARCIVEVLDTTPAGRQLLEDIKAGKKIGISTRGAGKLSDDKIVESIFFFTADIVSIPSCQNCWLSESTGEMVPNDFILEDTPADVIAQPIKELAFIKAFEQLGK